MTEVRPERPEDIDGIREVLIAAFETDAEAGLVSALRASPAWEPSLSLVAVLDGAVVAYALLSRTILVQDGDVPALALGPVAVLPALQKQGYGSAVITSALEAAGDRLIVVLGDPAYYGRFGFVPGAPFGITGEWSSFGDAWQIRPPPGGDGTPVSPGEVLYPPPWHDL